MYFVYATLILAGLALFASIILGIKEGEFFEYFAASLVSILVLGFALVIGGNALGLLWTDTVEVNTGSLYINSVADGQETHGHFFIGSGYIDSEPAYFFYYSTGPGQFRQGHVTGNVTIQEEEGATPRVEYFSKRSSDNNWSFMRDGGSDDNRTVIHVPTGTVIQNYVLDTSAK